MLHAHTKPESFYKFIEDDYSHANRTLLQLLLRDQGLVPRLNCLKRCFFLSHSSYLTHFLDLAHTELRKTAKAVSLVKLQSLLDLALGADAHGDDVPFREDVRVTMATTGLYDWLLRIVNVSGVIGDDGDLTGDGGHDEHLKKGKEKDEKKPMLGSSHSYPTFSPIPVHVFDSHRRSTARLQRQVSALARHLSQNHLALPASVSLPSSPQTRRAGAFRDVAGATGPGVAADGRSARVRRVASPSVRAARADARVGAADPRFCHPGSTRTELARPRGEIVKCDHGRPAVARSRRLSGHVHEGVHAYQFETVERTP